MAVHFPVLRRYITCGGNWSPKVVKVAFTVKPPLPWSALLQTFLSTLPMSLSFAVALVVHLHPQPSFPSVASPASDCSAAFGQRTLDLRNDVFSTVRVCQCAFCGAFRCKPHLNYEAESAGSVHVPPEGMEGMAGMTGVAVEKTGKLALAGRMEAVSTERRNVCSGLQSCVP